MERVLLVSSTEKGTAYLCALLKGYFPAAPALAKNGGEARRLTLDGAYDLVVINAPAASLRGASASRLARGYCLSHAPTWPPKQRRRFAMRVFS